jgi:hypothetical protein
MNDGRLLPRGGEGRAGHTSPGGFGRGHFLPLKAGRRVQGRDIFRVVRCLHGSRDPAPARQLDTFVECPPTDGGIAILIGGGSGATTDVSGFVPDSPCHTHESAEFRAEFVGVMVVEVDLVRETVDSEGDTLSGYGSVNVVNEPLDGLFGHGGSVRDSG